MSHGGLYERLVRRALMVWVIEAGHVSLGKSGCTSHMLTIIGSMRCSGRALQQGQATPGGDLARAELEIKRHAVPFDDRRFRENALISLNIFKWTIAAYPTLAQAMMRQLARCETRTI